MLYVVIYFLYLSILLYLLLGGADFGVGILELISTKDFKKTTREITYKIIGPIWEANHMWLIIAIVILFVGFPAIYTALSIYLHIPILLMLIGIIGRGTAFIFRHYDAVKDGMQNVYNAIFVYSSFVTPLFLGMIAGAIISGNIDTTAQTFSEIYLAPWTSIFSISVGLFTVSICGFLAAVYLTGESIDQDIKQVFIKKARIFNVLTIISGLSVFGSAYFQEIPLAINFITSPVGLIAIALATISLIPLWLYLGKGRPIITRSLAGLQIALILGAVAIHQFPDFIIFKNSTNLSLLYGSIESGPINTLGWALILGSLFILPALFYLIYSFQDKPRSEMNKG